MAAILKVNGTQSGGAGATLTLQSNLLVYYSSVSGLQPYGDISYQKIQYTVTSYPSSGVLMLSGVKINPGGTFTQYDVNTNRLSYTNDGKNTTPLDKIGVSIKDLNDPLGGVITTTINIKINLPPMPPSGKINPLSVKQEETKYLTRANMDYDDYNNPGAYDDIKFVITALPLYGDLYIDGKKVVGLTKADGITPWSFTQAQLTTGSFVKYTSVPTYPDALLANADSFSFYAVDPQGQKTTDTKFPIIIQIVSEPMSIVRDGPLLLNQKETKGIGPDVLYVSDPDTPAGNLVFTIKKLPTFGKMYKNISGTWTEFTLSTSFTQTDVNNGLLKYTNDGSENANDSFTFSVTDGVNVSPDIIFPIIIKVVINKPPVLNITPLTVYQAAVGIVDNKVIDLSDPEGVSNDLLTVTIKTLSAKGTLYFNSTLVTKDLVIKYSDIMAGKLTYKHNGVYAPESDGFDITASDGVKTTSQTTVPISVIQPPNKPPYLVNNPATICKNGGKVLMGNISLLWADDDDAPADVKLTITSTPLHGSIVMVNGTVETTLDVGTNISLADWQTVLSKLDSGIRYTNTDVATVAQTDFFVFTLMDAHGNVVGPFNHVININAPSPNNPPVLINNGKRQLKSTSDTIKPTELSASDSDNSDVQLIFTITELPTKGDLYIAGVKATVGSQFTVADIKALRLSYTSIDKNASLDMFAFTLTDGVSILSGVFTISLEDGLQVSMADMTVMENNSQVVDNTVLYGRNPSCVASQIIYHIVTPPVWGTLKLNNVPTNTFTQQDVDLGLVRYFQDVPLPPIADSFSFTVEDCLHASSAILLMHINIILVDGAPKVSTSMLTVNELNCSTIPNDNLRVVDSDTDSAHLIVTITSPVSYIGTIKVNGLEQIGGATFAYKDIEDGNVVYCAPNIDQAEYITDFVFTVSDGTNFTPGLLKIKILDVPSPQLTNYGVQMPPCSTTTINTSMLNLTGLDVGTLDSSVVFTITDLPIRCSLQVNGVAVGVNGTFTLQDIKASSVKIVGSGTDVMLDSFKFRWEVQGSSDLSGFPYSGFATFYIDLYYVNNPPWVCVLNDITMQENTTVAIDISHLAMCDVDLDDTPAILDPIENLNINNLGGLVGHIEARSVKPGGLYKWTVTTGVGASASLQIMTLNKSIIYQSFCVGQNNTASGTFIVPLNVSQVYVKVNPACSALFSAIDWTVSITK